MSFGAVKGAQSYVVHYIDKDTSNAVELVDMGYTETTTWELPESVHGVPMSGEKFTLAVQAFKTKSTISGTGVEKARDMHDNHQDGSQSEWSTPLTKITMPSS